MPEVRRIGSRELARRTSEVLDEVRGGVTFEVTRNTKPIAKIVPVERERVGVPVKREVEGG